jgi:hypothetical protein
LINCEAEGKVTLYESGILFDSVKFKNLSGTNSNIKSSEYLLFQGYEDNYVNVPDTYVEVCVDEIIDNKTLETKKVCHEEVKTYKSVNQPKEVWRNYANEILSKGDYRWKIKGVKDKN